MSGNISKMSVVIITLPLFFLSTIVVTSQFICTNNISFKEKRICFDLDKGRFVDLQFGRNSVYDMEVNLKYQEVSLGRNRRKPRACRGYNFYRRCQKKYKLEVEKSECRFARCSVCIAQHLHPDCLFCHVDKQAFCPAVETCSCPWKAGRGIWNSCRRQINNRCYASNTTKSKKKRKKKDHRKNFFGL